MSTPSPLFEDIADDACPHGTTPLPNRKPQLLLHRDRRNQLHRQRHIVPRHHHLPPPPHRPPHVIPSLTLIQRLTKHLHPRTHRLHRRPYPNNLHLITHLDHPTLRSPRHHRPTSLYRKYILHRQQKRLVSLPTPPRDKQ